jgi:L-alanine-DL-glutamate epimerase-like enolase superfamily enzyme
MKITKIEDLHCDAGWRVNSFLKVTTDEGIVGWSEYMEGYGAPGLTGVIRKIGERLIGRDPRPVEAISALALRRDPAGRGRHQPDGDRRDRERAGRHQGEGARRAGL